MVDLHDALRPTETAPPPPVGEIAARAERRQRRRFVVATGALALTMGAATITVGALLDRSDPAPTVADGAATSPAESSVSPRPDPSTSPPSTGATTTSTPPTAAPEPEPAPSTTAPDTEEGRDDDEAGPATTEPATTPGLRTSTTRTSEWADGYCVQVEVANEAGRVEAWQVVIDLGGTIDEVWNATVVTVGDRAIFSGLDDYNAAIESGDTTSFGTCVDTPATG